MRKNIISYLAVSALLLALPASVNAQKCDVSIDYMTGIVTVSGTAEKDAVININVLNPGTTVSNLPASDSTKNNIEYADTTVADENGKFSFTMKFTNRDEGQYTAYVNSGSDTADEPVTIDFLSKTKYEDKIDHLNGIADYETFKTEFITLQKSLGMYNSLEDTVNKDTLVRAIFSTASSTGLKRDNSLANSQLYYKELFTIYADASMLTPDNLKTFINNIGEETYANQFEKYILKDDAKKLMASKLSGKSFGNAAKLTDAVGDAIILTATRYYDSLNSVKEIYSYYASAKGFNVGSAPNEAYQQVMGKDFESVPVLVTTFNAVKSNVPTAPGGGSSSGGSGGGNKISAIISSPETTKLPEISLKFADLNSVSWAYSAISELYTRGIVSGKSETAFYPNDAVTREEFVKMIISMLGENVQDGETDFTDVPHDAWYAPYVNAAHKKGIINGISADKFGSGNQISRQDMAVIIYNILNRGKMNAATTFTDAGEISGYAEDAVNTLNALGIISGMSDGSFAPKKTATRAEAAVIIQRTINYMQK